MPDDSAMVATGLAKHYGPVRAVDGIAFQVRRGEIYGFLGRNGAGKTTTIRMLLGLIRPTRGEASILGVRMRAGEQSVLARVGSLVETAAAYPNLTVRENLDLRRRLTRAPRQSVDEAIALLHLDEYAGRTAGTLSLGNKQRLSLAAALLNRPELLILDEPVNTLDPAGIVEIRTLLRRLAAEQGVAIFMSSHILSEVSRLADRIGIIQAGKLIEEATFEELRQRVRSFIEIDVSRSERAAILLSERLGIRRIERLAGDRLRILDAAGRSAEMARLLVGEGLELRELSPQEEDLESYFMRLTGGPDPC